MHVTLRNPIESLKDCKDLIDNVIGGIIDKLSENTEGYDHLATIWFEEPLKLALPNDGVSNNHCVVLLYHGSVPRNSCSHRINLNITS